MQSPFPQGFRTEFRSILCLNREEGRREGGGEGRIRAEGREAEVGEAEGRMAKRTKTLVDEITMTDTVLKAGGRGDILETAL